MTERPINLTDEEVRAVLDGRKTQVRRPVERENSSAGDRKYTKTYWESFDFDKAKAGNGFLAVTIKDSPLDPPAEWFVAPKIRLGDRLWVREAWAQHVPGCEARRGIAYRADHIDPNGDGPANPMRWCPAVTMPRCASRITLEVLDVKVERVQDIGEEGAIAEGLETDAWLQFDEWQHSVGFGCECKFKTITDEFRYDWDRSNPKNTFDSNPWVWACTFRKLED